MDSNPQYLAKPVLRRDTQSSLPGAGAIKPMPEAEIAKAVQLLDLMLEFLQMTAAGRAAKTFVYRLNL
jgi:hypothetical protein